MNVKLEQDASSNFMRFFENARKPAAVLDIKGMIIS